MLRGGEVGRKAGRRGGRRLGRERRGAAALTGCLGRGAQCRYSLEPGQAGDAVGSFSLEARRGWAVLVATAMGARGEMAAMAIFNSGRRQGGQRGCRARRRAAVGRASMNVSCCCALPRDPSRTYGISEGVSGFEPGGGRLMKVGCDGCAIAKVVDGERVVGCDAVAAVNATRTVGGRAPRQELCRCTSGCSVRSVVESQGACAGMLAGSSIRRLAADQARGMNELTVEKDKEHERWERQRAARDVGRARRRDCAWTGDTFQGRRRRRRGGRGTTYRPSRQVKRKLSGSWAAGSPPVTGQAARAEAAMPPGHWTRELKRAARASAGLRRPVDLGGGPFTEVVDRCFPQVAAAGWNGWHHCRSRGLPAHR